MSENLPPPNARDVRAQAKADKAYQKARRPWYKKKRFLLPLALLVLIIIIAIATTAGGGGGDNNSTDDSSSPEPSTENTQTTEPAAFPGAEESDVVGQAGESLVLGDIAVTSTPLVAGDSTFGASTLCTTATVQNNSNETIDFSTIDWKLQAPSGTINNTSFTGSNNLLPTGQVAPGGTATGDVCFENDPPQSGQYVVLYEPVFDFFSDRGAWLSTL